MIRLAAIHRYPVKGLSAQSLGNVDIEAGETLPFDRAWAIENGPSRFDPNAPAHLPKIQFLMLMRQARLAALRTHFDAAACYLTITDRDGIERAGGRLDAPDGRAELEAFISAYCAEDLRGPPRIVAAPGHAFTDTAAKCASLINLASVRDLSKRLGVELDPARFRANLVIDGAPAWSELEWVDRDMSIGAVKMEPYARIDRCAATNVNPTTAERDLAVPRSLLEIFGHADFGIYVRVVSNGTLTVGDEVAVEQQVQAPV